MDAVFLEVGCFVEGNCRKGGKMGFQIISAFALDVLAVRAPVGPLMVGVRSYPWGFVHRRALMTTAIPCADSIKSFHCSTMASQITWLYSFTLALHLLHDG